MNSDNGRIKDLLPEEAKEAQKELEKYRAQLSGLDTRLKELQAGKALPVPKLIPITDEQEQFFKNQGLAFRALWAKRLARGLTPEQAAHLNELMAQDKLKE